MRDSRAAANCAVAPVKGNRQLAASRNCALLGRGYGSFMAKRTLPVGPLLAMWYLLLVFQLRELYLLLQLAFLSSLAKGCSINSPLTSVSCHFLLLFHLKQDNGHVIIIFFSNCHKDAECSLIRSGSVHGETSEMLSKGASFLQISVIELYSPGLCYPNFSLQLLKHTRGLGMVVCKEKE